MRPRAAIIDSIQTVYLDGVTGSAGSVSQVRYRNSPSRYCAPDPADLPVYRAFVR